MNILNFKKVLLLSSLLICLMKLSAADGPVIKGIVKEGSENLPVGFATISLHLPEDSSLVAGTVADESGNFRLNTSQHGIYLLRISFVGYTPRYIKAELVSSDSLDLGTVFLERENYVLEEAKVTGERLKAKSEGSNTIYYMNTSFYKMSHSGADLLKNIPGARFDMMQNFTIEGKKNVAIYVNGTERDMDFIRQLNPEEVDRIEVNSSPGAGYDANTEAVINLVLKEKNQGISGFVNAELPSSSSEIYLFPSYNLNYGREKFNIYTSYNGDYSYFDIQNSSSVMIEDESGSGFFKTIQDVRQKNWSHRFHAGIDYFFNEDNRLNLYASFHPYSWEQDGKIIKSYARNLSDNSNRTGIREDTDWNRWTYYSAYFEHTFNKPSTKISTYVNYSGLRARNTILYRYDTSKSEDLTEQFTQIKPVKDLFSIKSDFNTLFGNSLNYTAGIKINLNTMKDLSLTGFHNLERNYAIYNAVSGKFMQSNFNAGLRLEYTGLKASGNQVRNYLSLLPNLNIEINVTEKQKLNFSYRRSLKLPNIYQLNPAFSLDGPLQAYYGNPQLEPSMNNAFKIQYNIRPGKNYLAASLFYEKRKDAIAKTFSLTDTGMIISTTENPGNIEKYGLQLSGTWKIGNFLSFNHYLKLFGLKSSLKNKSEYLSMKETANFGFESSMGAIISLGYDINLSLQFQYDTPVREFQLETWNDPLYFCSVEKSFGNKLKLGISSGLPFQKEVVYQAEKVKSDNFDLKWTGKIKKSLVPVWINISYKFQSGKKVSLIEREKEILENVRKKGF